MVRRLRPDAILLPGLLSGLLLGACAPGPAPGAGPAPGGGAAGEDPRAAVTRLADEVAAAYAERYPELGLLAGRPDRYPDRLTDGSPGALRAREDGWARRLAEVDAGALRSAPEEVTLGFRTPPPGQHRAGAPGAAPGRRAGVERRLHRGVGEVRWVARG